MIMTEDQRRWWFAAHPEFSHSHKGQRNRKQGKQDEHSGRVRPEQVDAYVNDRLKYERDKTAIDLLNLEKQLFGTGSDYAREFQNEFAGDSDRQAWDRPAGFGSDDDNPFRLVGYNSVEGPYVFRWPSVDEALRLPNDIVRSFIQWLDSALKNNILIIDPNSLEEHHGLPKAFVDYFQKAGLNVEDYVIILTAAQHRLKPKGVHTGKGRGGDWNTEWDEFRKANREPNRDDIERHLDKMKDKYGIR
jgi:hypothetical protein